MNGKIKIAVSVLIISIMCSIAAGCAKKTDGTVLIGWPSECNLTGLWNESNGNSTMEFTESGGYILKLAPSLNGTGRCEGSSYDRTDESHFIFKVIIGSSGSSTPAKEIEIEAIIKSSNAFEFEIDDREFLFIKETDKIAPVITNITVSGITETGAFISWITDEPATDNIEYGPDDGYGSFFPSSPDIMADKTSHSLVLTGLSPDTTYYFKVESEDAAGNVAFSEERTFRTASRDEKEDEEEVENSPTDTTAPVISGITVSGITETGAVILWTTNEPATGNIEYGPGNGYGSSFPSSPDIIADNTGHRIVLTGLSPDTTYYFRVESVDAAGNEAVSGERTFRTAAREEEEEKDEEENSPADTAAPVISGITVSGITETGAVISWTTNEPATGNIEYGTDNGYGSYLPSSSGSMAVNTGHRLVLTGLSPGTTYYFRVESVDAAGNGAVSGGRTFRTASITNYVLTTRISPSRGGTITYSDSGSAYSAGTEITLNAVPADGYEFSRWSGDIDSNSTSITITMDENKRVTAHFSRVREEEEDDGIISESLDWVTSQAERLWETVLDYVF